MIKKFNVLQGLEALGGEIVDVATRITGLRRGN
jgi:hypothetical protein